MAKILPIDHVALSVPNIEAGIEWYSSTLGMQQLLPIINHDRSVCPDSIFFLTYAKVQKARQVLMITGDGGAGLELFEFQDPKAAPNSEFSFEKQHYTRGGFYHIGIFTEDVEGLCEKIIAHGGDRLAPTMSVLDRYKAIYAKDPWGNVIELVDFTFLQLAKAQKQS